MKIINHFWASIFTLSFALASISLHAREKAPDFSFVDLNGHNHLLSDYQGKWVLVNYWATYCPPCRAEIPDIERFIADNKDKITVLGMDAGGSDKQSILAFQDELDISYPLFPTQPSTLQSFGTIVGIPTSYVINPKGEIVDKFVGIITYNDLDYYVNPPVFEKTVEN